MTPEQFAKNEYRDRAVYQRLAQVESVPAFKAILEEFAEHEQGDFEFWKGLSRKKDFHMGSVHLFFYVLMRKVLGLTFTVHFLEGREKEAIAAYGEYLKTVTDPALKKKIEEIVEHERYHERALLASIEEKRVKFVSNIVLGLNDGLIELTGALTGFSFALQDTLLVSLAGIITGVSASLSMAASAYQQARHERGKNPVTAAIFTGVSYLGVVILLVAPFIFIEDIFVALGVMLAVVLVIIASISLYSSVLLGRRYLVQFGEMLLFSLGVAAVAFAIGSLLRIFIG